MMQVIFSSFSIICLASSVWAGGVSEGTHVAQPAKEQAHIASVSFSEKMDVDRTMIEVSLAVPMQVRLASLLNDHKVSFPWQAYWKKHGTHPMPTVLPKEGFLGEAVVRDAGHILVWQELPVEDHWDFVLRQNELLFGINAVQVSAKETVKFS